MSEASIRAGASLLYKWMVSAILAMALVPVAQSQQDSTSLGDAAREQRDLHKQGKPEKVYDNKDIVPEAASETDTKPEETANAADGTTPPAKATSSTATKREMPKADPPASRSALDRPKNKDEDKAAESLVVPAGTEIKVEIPGAPEYPVQVYKSKVVVPVRVGFATAIPALSQATVRVAARHYPHPYVYGQRNGTVYGNGVDTDYSESMEITRVTIEGVVYTVHTDQVSRPGRTNTASEVTFTLLEPLTIQR